MFGYIKMLNDLGIDQDQMNTVVDSLNVIDVKSNIYHRDKSNTHGLGMFVSKNINKGDIIGLGTIDNINKTFLGRYTNHSDNNNAMFYYLSNNDVVMIAKESISKDKEILIDYRDHVLKKTYLYEKYL